MPLTQPGHLERASKQEGYFSKIFFLPCGFKSHTYKENVKTENNIFKGANSRLVTFSASDSESDKRSQWQRWSEFFRSVIGVPIDQLPELLANGISYFFRQILSYMMSIR
jgi:hypothetical protein